MVMVRAQVQNIVYPFLDVAGDRLRPKGAHPEDLFSWINTHFGGRKTDRVEQLEEQMKQLRMADFEDVQSYMNAHRAIWATIEQIDPSYSEQKALRFLVNPRYLPDPFKSQGEYFAAAMRANVVQDYSIIKEAMLKTAFDAGLVSNHIHLDGWKIKKPGQGQVPKPSPMSAGEKDEAFIANENAHGREIELLRLQLQVSQSELALMVASGRGSGPRTMDKPAGGKSERKPTECWNKWCKQVGHRRDQCKTPKPADWEDRRGHDERGYLAAGHVVETVSELQGEIIHVPPLLPARTDAALLVHGEPRKLTIDGAATSDVSSLSFREYFTKFEAVKNQVLKTAGGDVKILGRATMVVELLDGQILTLRNVAVVGEGDLFLLSVGAWLSRAQVGNRDGAVSEVAYLPEKVVFRIDDKIVMQGQKGQDRLYGISFKSVPPSTKEIFAAQEMNLNLKTNENANLSQGPVRSNVHVDNTDEEDLDRHAIFYGDVQQTVHLLHLRTNHGTLGELQALLRQGAVEVPGEKRKAILRMTGRVPCEACDEANVKQKHPGHKRTDVRETWCSDEEEPDHRRSARKQESLGDEGEKQAECFALRPGSGRISQQTHAKVLCSQWHFADVYCTEFIGRRC